MDYTIQALSFNSMMNQEFNQILIEQMEAEYTLILKSLNMMQPVTEAPGDQEAQVKKEGFFDKMMAFLNNIIQVFIRKVRQLVSNDKKWLQQHYNEFQNLDYEGLEVNLIPFWNIEVTSLKNLLIQIMGKTRRILNATDETKYKDMKTIQSEIFSDMLDENGNLVNGLKNYFRSGNPVGPLKQVSLRNETIKKQITTEMLTFCRDYESKILPAVQSEVNTVKKDLEMIKRKVRQRKATKESFLVIENAYISQTDIGVLYHPVTEAEAPKVTDNRNQSEQTQNQSGSGAATGNQVRASVKDHGSAQRAQKSAGMDELNNDELIIMKNVAQIHLWAVTSMMTAMEERYHAYMTVMRQVIKARGKKGKEAPANEEPKAEGTK